MMNRIFVWLVAAMILSVNDTGWATEPEVINIAVKSPVSEKYNQLDFSGVEKLDSNVFAMAYQGYLNLLADNKLNTDKRILTLCDYSLSANAKRMWVIDLDSNKILLNTHVAHGQGTGEEYATRFSDKEGSHQSSIGFYITGDTYNGSHGNSLYLHGMDEGYNTAAYNRNIVVHGAAYVSNNFIAGTGRLGRSWGCPAVGVDVCNTLINCTKGGTCMFIYYPDSQYLTSSYWLNKKTKPVVTSTVNHNGITNTATITQQ